MATRPLKAAMRDWTMLRTEMEQPLTDHQWEWFQTKPRRILHDGKMVTATYSRLVQMGRIFDAVKCGDEILFLRPESYLRRVYYSIKAGANPNIDEAYLAPMDLKVWLDSRGGRGLIFTMSFTNSVIWVPSPGEEIITNPSCRLWAECTGPRKAVVNLYFRETKRLGAAEVAYVERLWFPTRHSTIRSLNYPFT